MPFADSNPSRRDDSGSWAGESASDAFRRAPEFGQRFLTAVFSEFPDLQSAAKFRRWSEQPDDIYVKFELPAFRAGVQLDPDLGYIIVWSGEGQAEFGDWGNDQVGPALEYFRRLAMNSRLQQGDAGDPGRAN